MFASAPACTACKAVPGKKVIRMEKIQAFRWINVSIPVHAEIETEYDGISRVRVAIKGYLSGTVVMADTFPPAPDKSDFYLENKKNCPITAEQLYKDGWMFHGPDYQGISQLGPCGDNGIYGVIKAPPGKGSLLDNVGQLFGYWVMLYTKKNRLAMPIGIDKIEIFEPHPVQGSVSECMITARTLETKTAKADMELCIKGKPWIKITGWRDIRFFTDDIFFDFMKQPGLFTLSTWDDQGFMCYKDKYKTAYTTDYLCKRYLTEEEQAWYHKIRPSRKRSWLNGRIAAKDAVRRWMFGKGFQSVYPSEIKILNDSEGKPFVTGAFKKNLQISIAHKDDFAVALINENGSCGIDIELIEEGRSSSTNTAFTPAETAMLPQRDSALWMTRLWSAKEAVAKSLGSGVKDNPGKLILEKIINDTLIINGMTVASKQMDNYIITWTRS